MWSIDFWTVLPRQFNGKIKVFSINGAGMTYKLIEKKLALIPTSHYTHNLRCIIHLNINSTITEFVKEQRRRQRFLREDIKCKHIKEKELINWSLSKLKAVVHQKTSWREEKDNHQTRKECLQCMYLKKIVSRYKRLVPRTYKEFLELNAKMINYSM